MKSTDLRIGNYVYYEHTTHIVSGVHENRVYSWWVKDGQPVIEYEAKDISGTQEENPYMDLISQHEPIPLTEEWFDETKAWIGHSYHRMFRHHSEGIFQLEEIFGKFMINSVGKRVYIRYIGEQHVKEDCNNYIPSAKEWMDNIVNKTTTQWMIKTLKIED